MLLVHQSLEGHRTLRIAADCHLVNSEHGIKDKSNKVIVGAETHVFLEDNGIYSGIVGSTTNNMN
jgi:hypothetical protein